jgi:hypothetical protein
MEGRERGIGQALIGKKGEECELKSLSWIELVHTRDIVGVFLLVPFNLLVVGVLNLKE